MSISSLNHFSELVLKHLFVSQNSTGNLAFSGAGIYSLMAVISVGLNGRTNDQLTRFLKTDFGELRNTRLWRQSRLREVLKMAREDLESKFRYSMVIFHGIDFKEHFLNIYKEIINTPPKRTKFSNPVESMREMNLWMELASQRRVTNMFSKSVIHEGALVLANSIVLEISKQDWFPQSLKSKDLFNPIHGRSFVVRIIDKLGNYKIFEDNEERANYLFLPFPGNDFFAVIVLPHEDQSITDFLKRTKPNHLAPAYSESRLKYLHVKIPIFNITSTLFLKDTFFNHGVTNLFTPGAADISGISYKRGFVEDVVQVASLVVNHLGNFVTEQTNFMESTMSIRSFYVNRPYMFYIYAPDTGLILFSAIITNPNEH
ncbi:Serpin I2 [Thelohanellus kitauei]|uniref:Serpin I2 n=1 Tax=Thelohanellus kitauei TaxID=669202 RepID=A0A0C2N7I0_THEKT|nr:Serpin I2 [Thelohanellus kitauei]